MTVRPVTPTEAAAWVACGQALIIDVRSPQEYRGGHIPAAVSLPLGTLPGALDALGLPPGKRLVFQCIKGGRSALACAAVAGAWPDSYNLEGGIEGWRAAGLPVVSEPRVA